MSASFDQAPVIRLLADARSILDVGCAAPDLSAELVQPGRELWGIESEATQGTPGHYDGVVGGTEDLVGRSFDAIVVTKLNGPPSAATGVLASLRELLTTAGSIVISVGNQHHVAARFHSLAGGEPEDAAVHLPPTPRWQPASLRAAIHDAGLHIDVWEPILFLPDTIDLPEDVNPGPETVRWVLGLPDSLIWRFVVRVVASTQAGERPGPPAVKPLDLAGRARAAAVHAAVLDIARFPRDAYHTLSSADREEALAAVARHLRLAGAAPGLTFEQRSEALEYAVGIERRRRELRRSQTLRKLIAPSGSSRERTLRTLRAALRRRGRGEH